MQPDPWKHIRMAIPDPDTFCTGERRRT